MASKEKRKTRRERNILIKSSIIAQMEEGATLRGPNIPVDVKGKELEIRRIEAEYGVTEGFTKEPNIKQTIIRKREVFLKLSIKNCAPPLIQTIFKNHPERYLFSRARSKQQNPERCIRNPPERPPIFFTFADDVYLNITCNLQNAGGNAYIRHQTRPKVINLKADTCAEKAFEEMLTREPHFYSSDNRIKKLSPYVEPNKTIFEELVSKCMNRTHFLVDFSLIYPENKVSTVSVICPDCGSFVETILWDKVVALFKEEIYFNIKNTDLTSEKVEKRHFVVQLPTRGVRPDVVTCSFVEGLMGVTILKGEKDPSTASYYVRNRLHYFCTEFSELNFALHNGKIQKNLHPTIKDILTRFGLK